MIDRKKVLKTVKLCKAESLRKHHLLNMFACRLNISYLKKHKSEEFKDFKSVIFIQQGCTRSTLNKRKLWHREVKIVSIELVTQPSPLITTRLSGRIDIK